jgi:heterodisulfide reductase subunit C
MKPMESDGVTHSEPAASVPAGGGPRVSACVQCGLCSASCGVGFASAHTPRKIIRFLQWELWGEAVHSPFLRLCKQCLTCTVRCPQEIDVAGVMRQLVRHYFTRR